MLDFIRSIFGRRPPLQPPAGLKVYSDAPDAPDMALGPRSPADPGVDGISILIDYEDARGAASRRIVRVRSIEIVHGTEYLNGWCELRRSSRTFRLDRVISAAQLDTGEVIDDLSLFLAPFLQSGGGDVGIRPLRRLLDAIADELRILTFLALSDGVLARKEVELLVRYVGARAEDLEIPLVEKDQSAVRQWIRAQHPDEDALDGAISRLARGDVELASEVMEVGLHLIAVDGEMTDDEREDFTRICEAMNTEIASRRRH